MPRCARQCRGKNLVCPEVRRNARSHGASEARKEVTAGRIENGEPCAGWCLWLLRKHGAAVGASPVLSRPRPCTGFLANRHEAGQLLRPRVGPTHATRVPHAADHPGRRMHRCGGESRSASAGNRPEAARRLRPPFQTSRATNRLEPSQQPECSDPDALARASLWIGISRNTCTEPQHGHVVSGRKEQTRHGYEWPAWHTIQEQGSTGCRGFQYFAALRQGEGTR